MYGGKRIYSKKCSSSDGPSRDYAAVVGDEGRYPFQEDRGNRRLVEGTKGMVHDGKG